MELKFKNFLRRGSRCTNYLTMDGEETTLSGKNSLGKSDEISVKRRIFFPDENFLRRSTFLED